MGLSPGAVHCQPCQMQRQPDTAQSPFLISSLHFSHVLSAAGPSPLAL